MNNSVFKLQFINCDVDHGLKRFLSHSIMKDVRLFNIPVLPSQIRIPIQILNERDFKNELRTASRNDFGIRNCFAYTDSHVHVLSYQDLKGKVARTDYLKMIRHECIHVLQHLSSRIAPRELIWLYESVACVIAKQFRNTPLNPPTWFNFTRHFYAVPECYAVAYHFGKAMLKAYSLKDLIDLSKRKKECLQLSRRIYKSTFNK